MDMLTFREEDLKAIKELAERHAVKISEVAEMFKEAGEALRGIINHAKELLTVVSLALASSEKTERDFRKKIHFVVWDMRKKSQVISRKPKFAIRKIIK